MSPVGAGDAPYLYISTSPGGLLPSPQLHVTPSQLKLDWKASPKRPETGVTAGVREWGGKMGGRGGRERKHREEIRRIRGDSCRMKKRSCREEKGSEGRPERTTWERERGDSGCQFMESLKREACFSLNTLMSQSAPSEKSFTARVKTGQLLGSRRRDRMEGEDEGKDGGIWDGHWGQSWHSSFPGPLFAPNLFPPLLLSPVSLSLPVPW